MLGFSEFFGQYENYYNIQRVVELYLHSQKKVRQIAKETDKSIGEIYRILHQNEVKPNRLRMNHQNVIDFADSGLQINQIAELTGYTPRNVRNILNKLKVENYV
jgi:DNA-binding NarL/FixJ family response regulator